MSRIGRVERDEPVRRVELEQTERKMPTTRSRRCRGIMPIGESVPCGVTSVTVSPTNAPSCAGQVVADQDAGQVLVARRRERVEAAARHRAAELGHVALERGSMPLTVMNVSPRVARDDAPCPRIAGAAADHAGHLRQARDFGVVVGDAARLPHVDVRRRAEDAVAQPCCSPS